MKITVVTPSFNQGEFIEETINSVLSQGVEDLEYIVVDGGSKDNTVNIIKKYEKYLSYWVTEPDQGQTHAIIKGFKKATGYILCYLNSDDVYFDNALKKVVRIFESYPGLDFLYGDNTIYYPDGRLVAKPKISFDFNICLNAFLMSPQPSSFWTRRIYDKVNGFNPNFQYCFDYDFFLRIGKELQGKPGAIMHVHDLWSKFRVHKGSKTISNRDGFSRETKEIRKQFNFVSNPLLRQFIKKYFLFKALVHYYKERGIIPLSPGPGSI